MNSEDAVKEDALHLLRWTVLLCYEPLLYGQIIKCTNAQSQRERSSLRNFLRIPGTQRKRDRNRHKRREKENSYKQKEIISEKENREEGRN